MRETWVMRDVRAGCDDCGKSWVGKSAHGTAARHHDATKHAAWVEVYMHVTYGPRKKKP